MMKTSLAVPSGNIPVLIDASIKALIERFARDQDVMELSRELYVRTLRLFMNWLWAKGYAL